MSRTLQRLKTPCHCGWKFVGFHLCTPPEKMAEARIEHPIKKPKRMYSSLTEGEKERKRERYREARSSLTEAQAEAQRKYDREYRARLRAKKKAQTEPKVYTCIYSEDCTVVTKRHNMYCDEHRVIKNRERWRENNANRKSRAKKEQV